MNLYQLIPFVALLVNLFAFTYVFSINRKASLNRSYLYLSGLVNFWLFCDFFHMYELNQQTADIMMRISSLAWMWVGVFYLNFIYNLLQRRRDNLIRFYLFSFILATPVFLFSDLLLKGATRYYWGYNVNHGKYFAYITFIMIILPIIIGLYLGFREMRLKPRRSRVLWPVLVGSVLMLSTGTIADFVMPTFFHADDFISLSSPSTMFLSFFIFIGIIRHGFMTVDVENAAYDIFNSINDSVLILNVDLRITMVNDTGRTFFVNQKLEGVQAKSLFKKFEINNDYEEFETELMDSSLPVSLSISPVYFRGELLGRVLVVRDLSKRQKLETEIIKRQKLESIEILAGGIAHDFNNILTAISSNLSILNFDGESQKDIEEVLRDTENAVVEARNLAGQLLTFSRGGNPIMEQFGLEQFINDTVKFALRGTRVNYKIEFEEPIYDLYADKAQIGQAMNNLLINSVQAMPQGGTITVSAKGLDLQNTNLLLLKSGLYISLEIKDEGCGISPENTGKVFDPYFSTKEQGTGLGLFSVYSIVQKHGGYIEVQSVLNEGTTFNMTLPARKKSVIERKISSVDIRKPGARILIMDDEEMILKAAARALGKSGYIVATALDGETALKKYADARESGFNFDVVIMDLTVPGKMGGAKCMEELLKIDSSALGIVSSGYSNDLVMSRYEEYGFSGVAPKPYRISELIKIIEKVMLKESSNSLNS
ncbi:MAG: response regulator [Deltaproteobacteria bacterium]|nr:response regulator [Deltaproteobacteria bacterium]